MKSGLVFITLLTAAGANPGLGNCIHDGSRVKTTPAELKERHRKLSMDPSQSWKMTNGVKSLSKFDLMRCSTCTDHPLVMQNDFMAKKQEYEPKIKQIYYINLAADGDRRKFINRQLKETTTDLGIDIPITRWAATDTDGAEAANLKVFTKEGLMDYVAEMKTSNRLGTIAVYLSQVRLLKKIYRDDPEGTDLVAIFEDDGTFDKNWVNQTIKMLKEDVPEDFDIFKIGYWGRYRCNDLINDHVLEPKGKPNGPGGEELYSGNVGYLVRPKSIPKILGKLHDMPLYDIDGSMTSLHKEFEKDDKNHPGKKQYGSWGVVQYLAVKPLVQHWRTFGSKRVSMGPNSLDFAKPMAKIDKIASSFKPAFREQDGAATDKAAEKAMKEAEDAM